MSGRFLLRKIGGRFEAIRRAMRSVIRAVTPPPLASLAFALALWCLMALALPAVIAAHIAIASARRVAASTLPTTLVIGVVCINPFLAGAAGGGALHKVVTIDHTKVGATDHTDFPVTVSGTYAYLRTVANGGSVQNANGYDVGFYSDLALTTKLKWETHKYVASTGEVVYCVKVPSVSHTTDTVFYMGYGDAGITTDQSDPTNAWNSGFNAVYHFGTSASLVLTDSTANALTLTNNGSVGASAGQVNGAANFPTPVGVGLLSHADTAAFRLTTAFTVEVWINAASTSGYRTIIEKSDGTNFSYYIDLETTTNKPRGLITQSGSFKVITSGASLSLGANAHVVLTYDGTTLRLFKNGVADGTLAAAGASDGNSDILSIGSDRGTQNFFQGALDEIRFSNVARSVDWLLATYNNLATPSTFYTLT